HTYGEYKQAAVHTLAPSCRSQNEDQKSAEIESAVVGLWTSKRPWTVSLSSRNHSKAEQARQGALLAFVQLPCGAAGWVGHVRSAQFNTTKLTMLVLLCQPVK